jgi:hypothetical protein
MEFDFDTETIFPKDPLIPVRIGGVCGLTLPYGTMAERSDAPIGTMRYNTDTFNVELRTPSGWISMWKRTIGGPLTVNDVNVCGTRLMRPITSHSHLSRFRRVGYTTNVEGEICGAASKVQFFSVGANNMGGIALRCVFAIPEQPLIQQSSFFAGMCASLDPTQLNNISGMINCVGISHDANSTNLTIIHAGDSILSSIPLGVSIQSNIVYEFSLMSHRQIDNMVFYRLENVATGVTYEGSISTNLPASSTMLGASIWRKNLAVNATVEIDIIQVSAETEY